MAQALRIGIPLPAGVYYPNYFNVLRELNAEGVQVETIVGPGGFDGLLLPGGGDVDPVRYQQANNGSVEIDPALDELQLQTMDRFVRAGKPVLGICRGHQVINIYFGGTLIQHLPESAFHSRDKGVPEDKVHRVQAVSGSWIAQLYGDSFSTNSSHHQGVDRPGKGLAVDLKSCDGVVEAMHHETLPVWSVQWHPERMCYGLSRPDTVDGSLVIAWFLKQCARARD